MPPSAFIDFTASCILGVGQIPRSTTSQPAAKSPASTADRIIGPDGLVSRQTRIRPRSRYVPKLSANSTASSGVKVSPTIPRTPVIPIFSGFMKGFILPQIYTDEHGLIMLFLAHETIIHDHFFNPDISDCRSSAKHC